jgi:hypothetical protein
MFAAAAEVQCTGRRLEGSGKVQQQIANTPKICGAAECGMQAAAEQSHVQR